MKFIYLALAMGSFGLGFGASAAASEPELRFQVQELPAADLLEAARSIFPQTGPAYAVTGTISCHRIIREVPPFDASDGCMIGIGNQWAELHGASAIIEILDANVKPITGPGYLFKGNFRVSSLSSEVPPYGSTDTAELLVSMAIPPRPILEAARSIRPQTSPGYTAEGILGCESVSMETPPYGVERSCSIMMDGQFVLLGETTQLFTLLLMVAPATGPTYTFESPFHAISIASEVPPYTVSDSAEVLLFR